MKVKPVRKINPNYPQKNDLSSEQLKGAIPTRWTNTAGKFALGVLALFLLTGCKDESVVKPQPSNEPANIVVIENGKEVEAVEIVLDGMTAPPKIYTFFRNIVDSISDLFDGND